MCCLKPAEDDVQVLDYEHSSLTDVPAEVFNHERTLEVLRLDCNQIADLPRPLFHCHGLKELWLSDNEISQLPPALASLIHLQVNIFHFSTDNKDGMKKKKFVAFSLFQVLDISKNALAEVPDAISGLKALITLDLSVNPLGTSTAYHVPLSLLCRSSSSSCVVVIRWLTLFGRDTQQVNCPREPLNYSRSSRSTFRIRSSNSCRPTLVA